MHESEGAHVEKVGRGEAAELTAPSFMVAPPPRFRVIDEGGDLLHSVGATESTGSTACSPGLQKQKKKKNIVAEIHKKAQEDSGLRLHVEA